MINKIHNADAIEFVKNIPDKSIDLIHLDPPYMLNIAKWDNEDIITFEFIENLFRILKNTGNLYCWCGIGEKSNSLFRWMPKFSEKFIFKDLITWKKQRGIGMRKGWLYTREELMWFVKDNNHFKWNKKNQYLPVKRKMIFTIQGKGKVNKSDYYRITNVWDDIPEPGYEKGSNPKKYREIRKHITPKPIKALDRIIKLHCNEQDTVLDLFSGSGVFAIACIMNNVNFICIEKDKETFDTSVKFISDFIGEKNV